MAVAELQDWEDPEPEDEFGGAQVLEALTEEECYLWAILNDRSGLDLAEFCVGEGQLVCSDDGWIPIEDVPVGAQVLTHKGRWRRVLAVHDRGVRDVVRVKGQGHPGLVVTPDHEIYIRTARRGLLSVDGHRNAVLGNPFWSSPQDFELRYRGTYRKTWWGCPSTAEPLPVPAPEVRQRLAGKKNTLKDHLSSQWLWLYGRYIADGCVAVNHRGEWSVTWNVGRRKAGPVREALRETGLHFSERTGNKVSDEITVFLVYGKETSQWLAEHGGKRAENKRLGSWVYGLDEGARRAVFDGLISGDGSLVEDGHIAYSTVSRQLAWGVRLLGASLGMGASVSHYKEYVSSFGGRGQPYYKVTLDRGDATSAKVRDEDGIVWSAVKEVHPNGRQRVFDLTVEDDHSFVVEGIVVHNCWVDEESEDGCWRAWPMQWAWYRSTEMRQVDHAGRALGKSESIKARACVHPFVNPGSEMAIVGPQKSHVSLVTSKVETALRNIRLLDSMLVGGRDSINKWPFLAKFRNGATIVGRIPQRDGKGFKGLHPVILELDEAQDLPANAWTEIRETLRREVEHAQWRVHGVSKGIPDEFQRITNSPKWKVHRITAYHKPSFGPEELAQKIEEYGSVEDPGYRRNLLGFHGESQNAIFDLVRLSRSVDDEDASFYNQSEYYRKTIKFEQVVSAAKERGVPPERYGEVIAEMLDFPGVHKDPKYGPKPVYWIGMDVGIAKDPSAILVFVDYVPNAEERRENKAKLLSCPAPGVSRLKLLTRVELQRITVPDQASALVRFIEFYAPRAFCIDSTGNGLGIFQELQKQARISRLVRIEEDAELLIMDPGRARHALTAIKGYNFGSKIWVAINETLAMELPADATKEEILNHAGTKKQVKQHATDEMRLLVDTDRMLFPHDETLFNQMTGQTFVYTQATSDAYGDPPKRYSEGQYHAFDGARMCVMGKSMQSIEEYLRTPAPEQEDVLDVFLGGYG